MDLGLKGKVAVITGPAKGIGATISLGFAREGAHLALLGRDTEAIKPVCETARALGVKAEIFACDVTDNAAVDVATDGVLGTFDNQIDILVNVAGGHDLFPKARTVHHAGGDQIGVDVVWPKFQSKALGQAAQPPF